MIGKWIYHVLSSDIIVSGFVDDKIFPVVISQQTEVPAISYRLSNSNPNGAKLEVSYFDRKNYDIIIHHDKYDNIDGASMYEISEAVRTAMDLPDGLTAGGVEVTECNYIDEHDDYDQEAQHYIRILTFELWIKRR